jgi:hypothetical protein
MDKGKPIEDKFQEEIYRIHILADEGSCFREMRN